MRRWDGWIWIFAVFFALGCEAKQGAEAAEEAPVEAEAPVAEADTAAAEGAAAAGGVEAEAPGAEAGAAEAGGAVEAEGAEAGGAAEVEGVEAEAESEQGGVAAAEEPLPTRPPVGLKVGEVVRKPAKGSPGWVIQQVLAASLEPSEGKGWALFASLLHEDEKLPKALRLRRRYNFPASRRKVKYFVYEEGAGPVYKVSRIVEEGKDGWRIFVHNGSGPDAMPTPCVVRFDKNQKAWRVGVCSL